MTIITNSIYHNAHTEPLFKSELMLSTCTLNPLCAEFFKGNIKLYLQFIYIIPLHWHGTGSWNPSTYKTRMYLFLIVYIMGADVLVTQGARASTTMISTMSKRNNLVPALQGLRCRGLSCLVHPAVRDKRRVSEIDLAQPRHEQGS